MQSTDMVRLLLDAGADVDAKSSLGSTPLHECVSHGGISILLLSPMPPELHVVTD
jgi:ankyrin repeat protein